VSLRRSSGILLHPTSLPGNDGIGSLGAEAREFVNFLVETGQSIWQVLPLFPTGYGDSPYQSLSVFAGNPLLISLNALEEEGLLSAEDIDARPALASTQVDYGRAIAFKLPLLKKAFDTFSSRASSSSRSEFSAFCGRNGHWLDDYALFMAVKDEHRGRAWPDWEPAIAAREPQAVETWKKELSYEIESQKFKQFQFFRQWATLKQYCRARGIAIMGDIPLFVAHDSVDVWVHREIFYLEPDGTPMVVAGVPPDYFSATGQLWGNPIYRWDVLRASGYRWWIDRLKHTLSLIDMARLDHFRGFEAYWEIPASAASAVSGRWVPGPGADFFKNVKQALGDLPFVAENLGVITPAVEALRNEFGFPGMAVLQFAFGKDPQASNFKPHNYCRQLVVYTGTHDNDTIAGWWASDGSYDSTRSAAEVATEKQNALKYLGSDGCNISWAFIRAVLSSIADLAIIPLQDILGLGNEARMNLPATPSGNWRWRYTSDLLTGNIREQLKELTKIYDRT
jgi:4-alpha-glucanotransferase